MASIDKTALYTIGGYNNVNGYQHKDIYAFACTKPYGNLTCSWTEISTKLQYSSILQVAMQIPNALADKLCSKECNCASKGTAFCNKATGECICKTNYCGEHCLDFGYGYGNDLYGNKKCKGQLFVSDIS